MLAGSENVFVVPPVSNKTINREIVTPHKISLMLLIKQQCTLKEKCLRKKNSEEEDVGFNTAYTKRFCLLALKLIQTPDLDYSSLKDLLQKREPGKELSPLLVKGFFDYVDKLLEEGVGALMDSFSNASRLISLGRGGCAKYSVLGLYLRRVLLSFDKLTFSQVVDLFGEFQTYTSAALPSGEDEEPARRWTHKEAEQLFAREAAKLLSQDPIALQEKLSKLLQHNPDFAEAHFLSFLNCVRCKELCGAKESLHQCFDRALPPTDKGGGSTSSCGGNGLCEERSFRYGTLNLAAMHVLFGHKEEALLALKEVIRLSHNAGDSVCLQHALSWLYNVSPENRETLIHRAMARCSDLDLGYLMSLAIQAFTKYSGQTGGRPSAVFDVVMKSDVLNCQQLLTELPANSYALKAALWSLYGQSNLSALYSQQLLRLRGSSQPPVCLALCNVARFLADQGEYKHSMTVLNEAQELFPRQHSWMIAYQEILFANLVNQSRFWEAMECVSLLAPVQPTESALRKIWLTQLTGNSISAVAQSRKVLRMCQERWYVDPDLPPLEVRTLMAVAECLQPGEALTCLLKALTIAETYYLHYLAAVITLCIANILLNLSLVQRAIRLTEVSLPYVMAHGSCETRGRALMLLARCYLANIPGKDHRDQLLRTCSTLTTAQTWLLKAQDYVRVKHCWYLKALIYHELGQNPDRNRCSYEFRLLEEIYPSSPAVFNSF